MDETPTPPRSLFAVWHWPRWTWVLILPLALLAYPLSAGPVVWMVHHGYVPQSSMGVLMIVYGPLEHGCRNVPLLDATLGEYVRWWRDLP